MLRVQREQRAGELESSKAEWAAWRERELEKLEQRITEGRQRARGAKRSREDAPDSASKRAPESAEPAGESAETVGESAEPESHHE
jgi:hypothetical protein